MPLLVIGCFVALAFAALAFAAVQYGIIPPPYATTLIRISGARLNVKKGRLRSEVKESVAEILREVEVSSGFIAITSENRVRFSRSVPPAIRQRLRNVLLNQWS
jgi:hypothetical protein